MTLYTHNAFVGTRNHDHVNVADNNGDDDYEYARPTHVQHKKDSMT